MTATKVNSLNFVGSIFAKRRVTPVAMALTLTCISAWPLAAAAAVASSRLITLEQAYALAKSGNLDVRLLDEKYAQAVAGIRKAWSGYLPQITLGGNYTYNSVEQKLTLPTSYIVRDVFQLQGPVFDPSKPLSIENPPGLQTSYVVVPGSTIEAVVQAQHQLSAQASVSQALIVPALWGAIDMAYKGRDFAKASIASARTEILFAVTQLYYGAAALKKAEQIQSALLDQAARREKDTENRFQIGAASQVDRLRAQFEKSKLEQDVLRTQNALASSKIALATLLQLTDVKSPSDFDIELPKVATISPDFDLDRAVEEALGKRPDARTSEASLQLSQSAKRAVWLKYFPSLVAQANYRTSNVKGFQSTNDNWQILLNAGWTIWDGGMREAELAESNSKLREIQLQRQSMEAKIRDELQRAVLDFKSAQANVLKAEKTVGLARETAAIIEKNQAAGAATSMEVSDAHTALQSAELSQVSEQLNLQLAAVKLQKARGDFGGD